MKKDDNIFSNYLYKKCVLAHKPEDSCDSDEPYGRTRRKLSNYIKSKKDIKESRKVYDSTMRWVERNARLPRFPVRPGMSQLLLVDGLIPIPFPSTIYPRPCIWIYGKYDALASIPRSSIDVIPHSSIDVGEEWDSFIKECTDDFIAFELYEFNPDVSLSYIWGNAAYPRYTWGKLRAANVPSTIDLKQGLDDYKEQLYE